MQSPLTFEPPEALYPSLVILSIQVPSRPPTLRVTQDGAAAASGDSGQHAHETWAPCVFHLPCTAAPRGSRRRTLTKNGPEKRLFIPLLTYARPARSAASAAWRGHTRRMPSAASVGHGLGCPTRPPTKTIQKEPPSSGAKLKPSATHRASEVKCDFLSDGACIFVSQRRILAGSLTDT